MTAQVTMQNQVVTMQNELVRSGANDRAGDDAERSDEERRP